MRRERTNDSPAAARRRREAGFSLVEVLVASVILGVIALGLVPLYSRAIRSNVEGFDYTQVSNFAKSRAEEYLQLPFASAALQVPGGATELEVVDLFSAQEHDWVAAVDAGDTALFTRTTTVRDFDVKDTATPLDGDAPDDAVHLKEITVRVEGTREAGSPLGPGKVIAVRVFKSQ